MMRWTTGALALGLALVACGGRYDPTTMEPQGAPGSGASSGATHVGAGASPSNSAGGSGGTASDPSAAAGMPTDELGPQCVQSGLPAPLTGPFAEPAVVWSRISTLVWGTPMGPMPFTLPATTSYEWAGDMVTFAIADVRNTVGGSRGLDGVLRKWLDLSPDAPLRGPWADALLHDEPALHALLLTPFFDPQRLGIFTEPSWLAEHRSISARGARIYSALLTPVPTPPPNVQPPLMSEPNVTERQALAKSTENPICLGCHQLLDPPGFALGHFDDKGAYRELDQGQPIDTTGTLVIGGLDLKVQFSGLQDFNHALADSCAANTGVAMAFLRLALTLNGVPLQTQTDYLDANAQRVRQAFLNGGRSYEALVKAYIQSPAGLYP